MPQFIARPPRSMWTIAAAVIVLTVIIIMAPVIRHPSAHTLGKHHKPTPTATPYPSSTPLPTLAPTDTPAPTPTTQATPFPTSTPAPTVPPTIAPTATPAPQPTPTPTVGPALYTVPASIPHDCSVTVEGQLMNFFATVPDGSTIQFQPGGCYGQDGTITLADRNNLDIDGNGSTFEALTTGAPNRANWRIEGGSNIKLEHMTVWGADPIASTTGAAYNTTYEWQHGFAFDGTQGGILNRVSVHHVYGDFVEAEPDPRLGAVASPPARNILVQDSTFDGAGRMGVGLTDVDGFVLQRSSLGNVTWDSVDLELDIDQEHGSNIQILGNTFGPMRFDLFSNDGAGSSAVGNVTISGNSEQALSPTCAAPVEVTAPSGVYRSGYTVQNNTFYAYGDGTSFIRAQNVAVSGNTIHFTNGGCGSFVGAHLTDSHTVGITNNALAGAGGVDSVDSLSSGVTVSGNTL